MDKEFSIHLRVTDKNTNQPAPNLLVEAWDKDRILLDDFVAAGSTDNNGEVTLLFDEKKFKDYFFDRYPDVYFKIFKDKTLILNTEDKVLCNLKPGVQQVALQVALPIDSDDDDENEGDDNGEPYIPSEGDFLIKGVALLSPEWHPGVLIEAFADADLKELIGHNRINENARFEIKHSKEDIKQAWFRWSQSEHSGRSPKLQPFLLDKPIRVAIYQRGKQSGPQRYQVNVYSTSGKPAVGMQVWLLEVGLRRCQLLGQAVTGGGGLALVHYDDAKLFSAQPDFRVIVADAAGVPLLESSGHLVEVPGIYANTQSLFRRLSETFTAEGLLQEETLLEEDFQYLSERSGHPVEELLAFKSAQKLEDKLKVPAEVLFGLSSEKGKSVSDVLQSALESDLISLEAAQNAEQWVPTLEQALSEKIATRELGRGSLDSYLATQISDASSRLKLARLISENKNRASLDEQIQEQGLQSDELKFLLDLQNIAGVDTGLAEYWRKDFLAGKKRNGEDFAALTVADWEAALLASEPAREQPLPEQEQAIVDKLRRVRAFVANRRAQRLYPEKAFRNEVAKYANNENWAKHLNNYLQRYPDVKINSPIAFGLEDVDSEQALELAEAAHFKKLLDITGDIPAAAKLRSRGVTSAIDLAAVSEEEFVATHVDAFEGEAQVAKYSYKRGKAVASALNFATSFLPVGRKASFCECPQCRSIFGPAAYLYELLATFLRYTNTANESLFKYLDSLCPHITHTHLSCSNSNVEVPQIDLINEVLEDQILYPLGLSVSHNTAKGACLPENRQTQGTSAERRAVPQNLPDEQVLKELQIASLPWTLPYDFYHHLGVSAREELFRNPEQIALLAWRYQVILAGTPSADASAGLGLQFLELSPSSYEQITTPALNVRQSWGQKIESEVADKKLDFISLAQVSRLKPPELEAVLDTGFVAGENAGNLRFEPQDFCASGEPPTLVADSATALTEVLDRFQRFERTRRHISWDIQALDSVLSWLGNLNEATLPWLGVLVFLQQRLRLDPDKLLALFQSPSLLAPPTLRPHQQVSPFAAVFGEAAISFELETGLGEAESSERLITQIAAAAGEPLATVDFVLREKLLAPNLTAGDIINAPDSQRAYRDAVAMTYRVATWAQRLRLDLSEFLTLLRLENFQILDANAPPQQQLEDALRLIDRVDQLKHWPVEINQLGLLTGDDPRTLREQGQSASEIGISLAELQQRLQEAGQSIKPLPDEPRNALRVALARLLMITSPNQFSQEQAELMANQLAEGLEWGGYYPARINQVNEVLRGLIKNWPLSLVPSASLSDAQRDAAFDELVDLLSVKLNGLARATGADDSLLVLTNEVNDAFRDTVTALLQDPSAVGIAALINNWQTMLDDVASAHDLVLPADYHLQLLMDAVAQLDSDLNTLLNEQAAAFGNLVYLHLQQQTARQVVVDWLTRSYGVTVANANTLLDLLSASTTSGFLIDDFISDQAQPSAALLASTVSVRYSELSSGVVLLESQASSLIFDWSREPPVAALKNQAFRAEINVQVPREHFGEGSSPLTLVVEFAGEVQIDIQDGDATAPVTLMNESSIGQITRHEVNIDAGAFSRDELILHIGYSSGNASTRVLKILQKDSDSELSEFPWAQLSQPLRKIKRAATFMLQSNIPSSAWTTLEDASAGIRQLVLDQLAGGSAIEKWQEAFALNNLIKRARSPEGRRHLLQYLVGHALTQQELLESLNLEQDELSGFLQLIGVVAEADKMVLPATISLSMLEVLLQVIYQATRFNLPNAAIIGWFSASPHQQYDWAKAALRANMEQDEWLEALARIYDPVRTALRDAQLDYLIARDHEITEFERGHFSDLLLTDVKMSPCMVTTRIQFCYASCQRYVEAAQRGVHPWIRTKDQQQQFERQWQSLRWYRLHEAQMRIVTSPELWYKPELRLHKSEIFDRFVQTVQSAPLTLNHAENSLKQYLAELTEVARLEPLAIVSHEDNDQDRPIAWSDPEMSGLFIIGRTRAHPKKLCFMRRLPQPDGRFLPFETIPADLEGTHYLALNAFGRFRLIAANFSVAQQKKLDECKDSGASIRKGRKYSRESDFFKAGELALANYNVQLSWIDRQYGKWSQTKQSDFFPITAEFANAPSEEDIFRKVIKPTTDGADLTAASITSIKVEVKFGPDGVNSGSNLHVYIGDGETGRKARKVFVGTIGAKEGYSSGSVIVTDGQPAGQNLQGLNIDSAKLRLEWHHGDNDDCDIKELTVTVFAAGNPFIYSIGGGKVGGGRDSQFDSSDESVQVWHRRSLGPDSSQYLYPAVRLTDGYMPGEAVFNVFETPLEIDLSQRFPRLGEFEKEYTPILESLNAEDAFALTLVREYPKYIDVLLSTHAQKHRAKIRARFRLKENIQDTDKDALTAWGTDWKEDEYCFDLVTKDKAIGLLRIYPDGVIELKDIAWGDQPPIPHSGTEPIGQKYLSTAKRNGFFIGHEYREQYSIYLSDGYPNEEKLYRSPEDFSLVVPRRGVQGVPINKQVNIPRKTYISVQPKLLEEFRKEDHSAARVLLIEQNEGLQDYFPYYEIPVFEGGKEEVIDFSHYFHVAGVDESHGYSNQNIYLNNNYLSMLVSDPSKYSTFENFYDDFWIKPNEASYNLPPHDVSVIYFAPDSSQETVPSSSKTGDWSVKTFWHPQVAGFLRLLESRGITRLMREQNSALAVGSDLVNERQDVDYFESYLPSALVAKPYPRDEVDFSITGAYSEYNWEFWFDCLLYLIDVSEERQQFDIGFEIFKLLINIENAGNPEAWEDPEIYRLAPISEAVNLQQQLESGSGLTTALNNDETYQAILAHIQRIRNNPYQPDIMLRGWPVACAKLLRIRLAEFTIKAGEYRFRRAYSSDNRTELELAASYFEQAARILGPMDIKLAAAENEEIRCFDALMGGATNKPPSDLEILEAYLPASYFSALTDNKQDEFIYSGRWQFCVPTEDKLNELRTRVADHLANLYYCRDIDGVKRALSIYGRRIDPALLVRATAEGMDLDVVLGRLGSARPVMGFQALWQHAMQTCERARSFEESWFATKERLDSEEFSQLQNEQEIALLEAVEESSALRLDNAKKIKESLQRTIESAEIRHTYFSGLERENAQEAIERVNIEKASEAEKRGAVTSMIGSGLSLLPALRVYSDNGAQSIPPASAFSRNGIAVDFSFGGKALSTVAGFIAEGFRFEASEARIEAAKMGREGSFNRRDDDAKNSAQLAQKDLQKGELDMAGAELQIEIANLELDQQKQRTQNAKAIRSFIRNKFSSKANYTWKANLLNQLRYQQHKIAFDLVLQTKAALNRAQGLEDGGPISDTWDASYEGVGAAAGLIAELEKLMQRYRDTLRQENQKRLTYSLVDYDPLAFLELIQKGSTIVNITEFDYDAESAGDWYRRIRHLSLDVPAVKPPHSNINAKVTQLRGEVRKKPYGAAATEDYPRQGPEDARFVDDLASGDFMVTNTGVQDDGRLEPVEGNDLLPPFVFNGAIGSFKLDLHPEQNHFDRSTCTDFILKLKTSSRAGGEVAMRSALEARAARLAEVPSPVMIPLHSMMSNQWGEFIDALAQGENGILNITVDESMVPKRLHPFGRIVQTHLYLAIPNGQSVTTTSGSSLGEIDMPRRFQPERHFEEDSHYTFPIHRLKLRQPIKQNTEAKIELAPDSADEGVSIKQGWLVFWVEGAS